MAYDVGEIINNYVFSERKYMDSRTHVEVKDIKAREALEDEREAAELLQAKKHEIKGSWASCKGTSVASMLRATRAIENYFYYLETEHVSDIGRVLMRYT